MPESHRSRPRLTRLWARLGSRHAHRGAARGQALAEFAMIAPVLLLIVVAIADFGRLYNSMVAIETAAREAADYGSFKSSYWDALLGNPPITEAEMERRACTAAWGSHLEDYQEPGGTLNHATCTNPAMTCVIEPSDGSPIEACDAYSGSVCSVSATEPPCVVHVTLTYTFRPFFNFSLFGWTPPTVTFDRESLFRVSDLPSP
jgi:Flp pilus assembly protein TadG